MSAPGWYADPADAGFERYWDGYRWTPAVRLVAHARGRDSVGVIASVVVGAIALVSVVVVLLWHPWASNSHQYLDVTTVERFIEAHLGARAVLCNGGRPVAIETGRTFRCFTASGQTFHVRIDDLNGTYTVS